MNDGRSTTGWIVLICLVGIILFINFGLISAFSGRRRTQHPLEPLFRVKNGFMHPWKNEDDQLNELKKRVDALQNPPAPADETLDKNRED